MSLITLYINSKNRISGTASDFKINISPLGMKNIKSFNIKNVTIPYSFYTTVYNNGSISGGQSVEVQVGFLSHVVFIPFGNYPYSDLCLIIQDQLNLNIAGSNFSVTYNQYTSKFTISNNVNFSILWGTTQDPSTPDYKLLSNVMGFNKIDLSGSNSYTSSFTANLSGPMNLYIKSSALTYQRLSYFQNKADTVVQVVPILSGYGGIIYFQDPDVRYGFNGSLSLSNFDFQLVDEYNNTVDLNGLDWSFVICFYSDYI